MPPSSMSTLVSMVRLLVMALPASPVLPDNAELSMLILSCTSEPPWLSCGVILRMVPTSWRCTVVKGFTSPWPLPVLVYWPVMNGTSWATLICASWLSMVTADGVEIRLVFESPCSARIIAAKFTPVAAMRPMPKVVPVPSAAGALEGLSTACASCARLTPPTGDWNVPRGMLLLSSDHTAQFTPSSASLVTCTSTMMASTSTCARRMSSFSITDNSDFITLAGAVITRALVSGSAQMVVDRSALAATPPPPGWAPPAGAPPVMATVALICSLSLVAIFSASAYCR